MFTFNFLSNKKKKVYVGQIWSTTFEPGKTVLTSQVSHACHSKMPSVTMHSYSVRVQPLFFCQNSLSFIIINQQPGPADLFKIDSKEHG